MPAKVHTTLLIDDSDIDLFIQRRFLEVYQFSNELIAFRSAKEALSWLGQLNGDRPPEIIFLDLNMPEMDGFDFLKSFETLPAGIRSATHIVVLTSSNSNKDREQAFLSSNVIQFITKPLKQSDIEALQETVEKLNGRANP